MKNRCEKCDIFFARIQNDFSFLYDVDLHGIL